jgi:hypothetical protein
MYEHHAMAEDWHKMPYETFLQECRFETLE